MAVGQKVVLIDCPTQYRELNYPREVRIDNGKFFIHCPFEPGSREAFSIPIESEKEASMFEDILRFSRNTYYHDGSEWIKTRKILTIIEPNLKPPDFNIGEQIHFFLGDYKSSGTVKDIRLQLVDKNNRINQYLTYTVVIPSQSSQNGLKVQVREADIIK